MKILAALLAVALGARAADAPPPPPEERLYRLRVRLLSSDERVELWRATGDAPICVAPCGTELQLRPGDEFRLTGPSLAPSDDFTFRPRDGEVTLRVHPRPQAPRRTAKGIIIAGVILGGISSVLYDAGAVKAQGNCFNQAYCTFTWNGILTAGVIGLAAGVVTLVAGIVMLNSNPPTDWETVAP